MKLLKLTYLAQGWMLGLYSEPLIWNDVEAWRYGPVFREIYNKVAGKSCVTDALLRSTGETFASNETDLIEQVWRNYGQRTGLALSALTHAPGSPWDITYRDFGQNSVIPKKLISEYYAKSLTQNGSHGFKPLRYGASCV